MLTEIILLPFYLLGASVFYVLMSPFMLLAYISQSISNASIEKAAETSNEIWELLRVQAITRDMVEDHPSYKGQAILRYKVAQS